jgi:hypothetical protein
LVSKSADASSTREAGAHGDGLAPGSPQSFGFVMAGAFAVLAAIGLWRGSAHTLYFVAAAAGFAACALGAPHWLQPLNKLWFRFGLLLNAVVSPLVMALIFFLAITPTALLMRALGKRPLALAFDRDAPSYWIHRTPPGPPPDTLTRQF